jgi:hypothetical protein
VFLVCLICGDTCAVTFLICFFDTCGVSFLFFFKKKLMIYLNCAFAVDL